MNNIMESVKHTTKSVTQILVCVLVTVTAFLFAKVLGWLGIVNGIISFYNNAPWLFWTLTVITRVGFIAVLYFLNKSVSNKLVKEGFFWFKPRSSYSSHKDEEPVDKSALYFVKVFVFAIALFYGELAISLVNCVEPPYLIH